jgi:glucose/arabinose dehydrogenase
MGVHITLRFAFAALVAAIPAHLAGQTFAERIGSSFQGTMFGAFAPGDEHRLFVARIWNARIEIIDLTTRTVRPDPFLVITDQPSPLGFEQGLLGLTFDPDYAANGYFYVNYTGADNSLNVVRYRVLGDPATSNVADPTSAHKILNVPRGGQTWHNGGWIDFGSNDGYLYVSIGDPCCANAQDIINTLHGKILRVDVRGDDFPSDPMQNYAIPPTNPFVGTAGKDAIWAYGLRNPWRASFDRLTGDLWINDTGEVTREEVNFQPADSMGGENYGWPMREGSTGRPPPGGSPPSPEWAEPVYDYPHAGPNPAYQGLAISAAGFYRGPVDAFYGHYFFSDFSHPNLWKLDPDAVDRRASVTNVNSRLLPDVGFLGQVAGFARTRSATCT